MSRPTLVLVDRCNHRLLNASFLIDHRPGAIQKEAGAVWRFDVREVNLDSTDLNVQLWASA